MVGLLWLLAAVEVLGNSYPLQTWTSFLQSINSDLPVTNFDSWFICYYFDFSQTCSMTAARTLLSDPSLGMTWIPTANECESLLDQQRIYAESVASSVFDLGITSAADGGVADFELLAQSWILRVGYHSLSRTHAAFVAAINGISDWTTVHCDGTNILFEGGTIAQPDFFELTDCLVLGSLYEAPVVLNCEDASCSITDGATCCMSNGSTSCCGTHESALMAACNTSNCPYSEYCCNVNNMTPCCPP